MNDDIKPTASGVYQAMLGNNLELCTKADLAEAKRLKAPFPRFLRPPKCSVDHSR